MRYPNAVKREKLTRYKRGFERLCRGRNGQVAGSPPVLLLPVLWGVLAWAALEFPVVGEPAPGDVFREYYWTNPKKEGDGFLRVGGRLDYGGGPLAWPQDLDLEHAIRAEVVIEKLLCHDGTRGLAISVNSNDWISVPEAEHIPAPQWNYQHHFYPVVVVPLGQFKGGANQFRLKVSGEHPWNWPQNLIYGVHCRIYYDPARKPHPVGRIVSLLPGATLGKYARLAVETENSSVRLRRVDFLGDFEAVNLEGDGRYKQWHYHYFRGVLTNHLGSVTGAPWQMTWETSWVPDQKEPFRLAARLTDASGLVYFTAAVDKLSFHRENLRVELCRPLETPVKWVTRAGEKEQKFVVTGDPAQALAAQFVWTSWSPGYMEGLYLNGQKVFEREGPRYACHVHRVPLKELHWLKAGENILKTGQTPKHDGKMVHGMEVNWPGIMTLIQYRK